MPNLSSSVVRALGHELRGEPRVAAPLAPDLDPFAGDPAEGPVVVLLVDGLGWRESDHSHVPSSEVYPAAWSGRARPITTVFPTTTTVALTSLTSAQPPSRNGVVGHRIYLPTFGVVAEVLRMAPNGVGTIDALAGPGWVPAMVSGSPSIFRLGVPGVALSRDRFESSAFTRMVYDGATYVGFSTASDLAYHLRELLGRAEPPSLIFAYWDDLDTIQHLHGPSPDFDAFESRHIHAILAAARQRLDPKLARRTTVIVTSDHGQVPADPHHEFAIDARPEIVEHLARPPTGDRRVGFLTARPGHLQALTSAVEAALPSGHRILPMPIALEAGLFGPPPYHPELSERLGDLLVLVPSPACLTYRLPGAAPRGRFLLGAHGGLDPAELVVPLVAGPLSKL